MGGLKKGKLTMSSSVVREASTLSDKRPNILRDTCQSGGRDGDRCQYVLVKARGHFRAANVTERRRVLLRLDEEVGQGGTHAAGDG